VWHSKVLRTYKTFASIWLLATCALAQPGATSHKVQISVQEPSQLSYRAEASQPWTVLGTHQGSKIYELPSAEVLLRTERDHGLWSEVATRSVLNTDQFIEIKPKDFVSSPQWGRIVAIGLTGLLLCVLLARGFFKQVITGTNQEPLIRPDGRVPKRKVGNYRLTGVLGTGGMGVVYHAEDEEGHQVAIKVPAPHLVSQSDFHQRFLREIELGLKLKHPRVVKVLEMPLQEELYVVLEYVRGTPLDKVPLEPWSIEWKRCLEWAAQTLEALAYIHSQGVIHRDLKPANLMILPDFSLKLMDFGIAHKIHGTRLTGTDSIMGTPIYMAPEQLQGRDIDPRADLFSLGLILYERLRPGLPYSDDLIETLRQKLSQPMISLRETNPKFPSAFDEFIMTLLAMNPDDRFPDAQSALHSLKPLLTLTKR